MAVVQLMMHRSGVTNHTVNITPDPVYSSSAAPSQASAAVTANVTDGVGAFTYAWSWDSGGSGMSILNSTSATCTIITDTGAAGLRSGVLKCEVTDTGNGSYAASDTVTAELEVEL